MERTMTKTSAAIMAKIVERRSKPCQFLYQTLDLKRRITNQKRNWDGLSYRVEVVRVPVRMNSVGREELYRTRNVLIRGKRGSKVVITHNMRGRRDHAVSHRRRDSFYFIIFVHHINRRIQTNDRYFLHRISNEGVCCLKK